MQESTNLELARSNGRYQLPVDNIGEMIVKLDNRNRIRFAAPSFLPDIWEN